MINNLQCGVDIIAIDKIVKIYKENYNKLDSIYTKDELAYCHGFKNPFPSLAARFAAKEAFFKLFPKETSCSYLKFNDIEIKNNNYGAPYIVCNKNIKKLLNLYNFLNIAVSLSHTKEYAIAQVVAYG